MGFMKNGPLFSKIPKPILALLVADAFFAVMYIINIGIRGKNAPMSWMFDVNRENSIPTWFSTVQLFIIACALIPLAWHEFRRHRVASWMLWTLSALFFAMSMDEVAMIHEWAGENLDELFLEGGHRKHSQWFRGTGIWVVIVPIPFIALLLFLNVKLRDYLVGCGRAKRLFVVGIVAFLIGAVGSEYTYNLMPWFGIEALIQIMSEEYLEMTGATLMLWGVWELLIFKGFRLGFSHQHPDSVARTVAREPVKARNR